MAYTEILRRIVSFLAMLYMLRVYKGFNFKSSFKTLYLTIKITLLVYAVLLISTTKHLQVATTLKIYYATTASDLIKFIKTPVSYKCMLDCKNKQPIKYFFFWNYYILLHKCFYNVKLLLMHRNIKLFLRFTYNWIIKTLMIYLIIILARYSVNNICINSYYTHAYSHDIKLHFLIINIYVSFI